MILKNEITEGSMCGTVGRTARWRGILNEIINRTVPAAVEATVRLAPKGYTGMNKSGCIADRRKSVKWSLSHSNVYSMRFGWTGLMSEMWEVVEPIVQTRISHYVCQSFTFVLTCASFLLGSVRLQYLQPWQLTDIKKRQSGAKAGRVCFDRSVREVHAWATHKWRLRLAFSIRLNMLVGETNPCSATRSLSLVCLAWKPSEKGEYQWFILTCWELPTGVGMSH